MLILYNITILFMSGFLSGEAGDIHNIILQHNILATMWQNVV